MERLDFVRLPLVQWDDQARCWHVFRELRIRVEDIRNYSRYVPGSEQVKAKAEGYHVTKVYVTNYDGNGVKRSGDMVLLLVGMDVGQVDTMLGVEN